MNMIVCDAAVAAAVMVATVFSIWNRATRVYENFRLEYDRILHGFSFDVFAHFLHSAPGALLRNLSFFLSLSHSISRCTTVPHWIRLTKNQ